MKMCHKFLVIFCLCAIFGSIAASSVYGQEADYQTLASMSLEDLMNITVTSVSKREERAIEAAAAIYVITAEEIRRSPANSIPELLRGVPGLSVAKLDSSKWAISIRGYNDRFSNKLLVLIDGRTVYTPLFSGVFWEFQDLVLEDIERIEIIRGPGATHWGSNAVNGVINITTKRAKDTSSLVSIGVGSEEQFFTTLRSSGAINEKTNYRLSLRYAARDSGDSRGQRNIADDWETSRAAFRMDYEPAEGESLTLSADAYRVGRGEMYELVTLIPFFSFYEHFRGEEYGGHLILDWQRTYGERGEIKITGSYTRDNSDGLTFQHTGNMFNLELRHSLNTQNRHRIMWGAGLRYHTTDPKPTQRFYTTDRNRSDVLYSAFITDEIRFMNDRLRISPGVRIEYLDYGGDNPYEHFDFQPSLRITWTPNEKQTVWAAVSRAVRVPSETEVDEETAVLAFAVPFLYSGYKGSKGFEPEELIAYELGYRIAPNNNISIDGTIFYNDYDNLRSLTLTWPQLQVFPATPHIWLPFEVRNTQNAHAWGFEVATDIQIKPWWRLELAYTYLDIDIHETGKGIHFSTGEAAGTSPNHQVSVHNHFNLPEGFELDTYLQYVDDLEGIYVDEYWDLNVRLGWQVNEHFSAELVGQNLLRPSRMEFTPSFVDTLSSGNERGIFGKLTWTF